MHETIACLDHSYTGLKSTTSNFNSDSTIIFLFPDARHGLSQNSDRSKPFSRARKESVSCLMNSRLRRNVERVYPPDMGQPTVDKQVLVLSVYQ